MTDLNYLKTEETTPTIAGGSTPHLAARQELSLADKFRALADKVDAAIALLPDCGLEMHFYSINVPLHNGKYDATHSRASCGTVGCAAGWLAVALNACADPKNEGEEYLDGIDATDQFLGLNLKKWARLNPQIWGENSRVWSDFAAWDETSGEFPPARISQKFREVAERLDSLAAV